VHLVLSKQDRWGRWKIEHSLNGKMWADIEKRPSQQVVTLQALRLKEAHLWGLLAMPEAEWRSSEEQLLQWRRGLQVWCDTPLALQRQDRAQEMKGEGGLPGKARRRPPAVPGEVPSRAGIFALKASV
jgi:hypothetical protein